jgi:hypothetical protein
LKKAAQKTSMTFRWGLWRYQRPWFGGVQASEPQAESSKSLFGSFSEEKEPL